MPTITLSRAGETSGYLIAPAGARVTLTGSATVYWAPAGSIQDAKEGKLTFQKWPLTTAGYCDCTRAVVMYFVAGGACSLDVVDGGGVGHDAEQFWASAESGDTTPVMPVTASVNALNGGIINSVGGVYVNWSNTALAYPYDSDGIDAAIQRIVASGSPGVVVYAAATYSVARDHALVSGVSHIGQRPQLTFSGDIPDAGFSCTGGTRWNLAAGVTGLKWNNIDKVSNEANIAENACSGTTIENIAFIGGLRALDTGAVRAMGLAWCRVANLYAFDQTGDYAFDLKNFQHCEIGNLYTSTVLNGGSGIRLASLLDATTGDGLIPGNSTIFGEIYTYCTQRKAKSIWVEAGGVAGAALNQICARGARLQGNRYGATSPDIISATTTSGSANIAVPNASVFGVLAPVVFATTAPTGFSTSIVYYVLSINTTNNTITLAENPYDAAGAVPTSSGSYNLSYAGYESIKIHAAAGCQIKNSDFGHIDAETIGNVCAVSVAKTRNCRMFLAEVMTSATSTAIAARDVECTFEYAGAANLTQCQSANYGAGCNFVNLSAGPYTHSGSSVVLDSSWNGRKVRYTGTTDINVTAMKSLPRGFKLDVTATGATGSVTGLGESGAFVFTKAAGTKTQGQYATLRLRNIANKVYVATGDIGA